MEIHLILKRIIYGRRYSLPTDRLFQDNVLKGGIVPQRISSIEDMGMVIPNKPTHNEIYSMLYNNEFVSYVSEMVELLQGR